MRVFLDTNVLASAAATRGLCADVLREVLSAHEILIFGQVLDELQHVLASKFRVPQPIIDDFLWLLRQDAVVARPERLVKIELKDKADIVILSAAISAGADVFIAGDKELLDIGRAESAAIVSPRQFWEKIQSQPQPRPARRNPRR